MTLYAIKIVITVLLVIIVSEIVNKSSLYAGIFASIPLVSVIAIFWIYIESKDVTKIIALSNSIFWLVIPSLVLFITLPILLKNGINFYVSISTSIIMTVICYFSMIYILGKFGIKI